MVPEKSALVVIDMQNEPFSKLSWVGPIGDGPPQQRLIERLRNVLNPVRQVDGLTVIYTREGHRPDLSDCPRNQLWRSRGLGGVLVRGEPGWEIIAPLSPRRGEIVIDKPGKSAFWATDFDLILRNRKITHLVLAGLFTDGAVHSTMREANDRGYECLLLEDCTAATDDENYRGAIKTIKMSGGIFGAVAPSQNLVRALTLGSNRKTLKGGVNWG
jgi:nicotinamidase-related amidase